MRAWGGVVSSEEPSDWSVPYLDLVHHGPFVLNPDPGKGPAMGIPIPLFNLVYHDADAYSEVLREPARFWNAAVLCRFYIAYHGKQSLACRLA